MTANIIMIHDTPEKKKEIEIRKYPDKIMLTPTHWVNEFRLLDNVIENLEYATANPPWGICYGMSANQVGNSLRVMICNHELFVNPQVVSISKKIVKVLEGCYSLEEKKQYRVIRAKRIKLEWQTRTGEKKSRVFHNFEAQIIQHCLLHLDGIPCNAAPMPMMDVPLVGSVKA